MLIHQLPLQSPGLSDQTADNSCHDDASSTGAKDDEEDDDDEDDKLEGLTGGDPEKLKAFNVSIWLQSSWQKKFVKKMSLELKRFMSVPSGHEPLYLELHSVIWRENRF